MTNEIFSADNKLLEMKTMSNRIYDTVIIGGGPSGYSAALYASRAGLDTLVIEKMSAGGQMLLTDIIENYPGFQDGIDGFTLSENMRVQAEKYGAETVYDEISSCELSGIVKKLSGFSGEYLAKTVIIATGASPRRLGLDKEEKFTGRGVHYCAHCDGRFYKDKTVAVIGGGNSAVTDALYLSKLARKVYLIHRRDALRATKIYQKQLGKASNIEILYDSVADTIKGDVRIDGLEIYNVRDNTTRDIACDGIFISIGRKPETGFSGGEIELDDSGYIVAGEDTKTNLSGVFAAGDVRTKRLRQVVTAAADGAVAAELAMEYIEAEAI